MTKKSQRVAIVVLGTLLGTFVSGSLCFLVWYFVDEMLPPQGFFGHWPVFSGVIGFGFGAVGGFIIGLVVSGFRFGLIASGVTGLVIDGLILLMIAGIMDGPSSNYSPGAQRALNYESIGQAVGGVVVGLLISVFTSYMERRQRGLQ